MVLFARLAFASSDNPCRGSPQSAPPVVTSKCTTSDAVFLGHFLAVCKRWFGSRLMVRWTRVFQTQSDAVPPRGRVRGTVVPCFVSIFGREAGLFFSALVLGAGISSPQDRS